MIIRPFAQKFDKAREALAEKYRKKAPESYEAIVQDVVEIVLDKSATIHKVVDGDYQGTLVFVVCYYTDHYAVCVDYGSCSGCDTLEAIDEEGTWGDSPTYDQVRQYVLLALHIVQKMKKL